MKLLYSHWFWLSNRTIGREKTCFVLFRKDFFLPKLPKQLCLRISADSRYKLYVNGVFAEYGPAKGDGQVWYYDELDIAP